MPYTNPTWWCDEPRGPTFLKAGEAPLAHGLDGRPYHERYGPQSVGWTTTPWHPAVRAANRELRRQFVEDYPVDILFQDQVGARDWVYDRNPGLAHALCLRRGLALPGRRGCPGPTALDRGRLRPRARRRGPALRPDLRPGSRATTRSWARPFKSRYPAGTWEIFPVAQVLAHEKAAMLHHDLGKFVSDRRTLAWTLGLGFAMSERVHARAAGRAQAPGVAPLAGPDPAIDRRPVRGRTGRLLRTRARQVRWRRRPHPRHLRAGAAGREPGPGPAARRTLKSSPGSASQPPLPAWSPGTSRSYAGHDFGPDGTAFVVEGTATDAELWAFGPPGRSPARSFSELRQAAWS